MKAGVIITAAGMSSRMGELKLILKLGTKTIIEHMVDNADIGEINEIVVVAGREKEKLVEKISNRKVRIVINEKYHTSDMMMSVQCGIRALSKDIDCFFIIPGDMPLVKGACYFCMLGKYDSDTGRGIVKIRYEGKNGHPLLIGSKYRECILQYRGGRGLKDALKMYSSEVAVLKWYDQTILTDVDTREDYEQAKLLYKKIGIPKKEIVLQILKAKNVPPEIIAHSLAVEKVAMKIAGHAKERDYLIDIDLVSAAALLHDVVREQKRHAEKGAEFVSKLGYDQVAEVIREHMFLSEAATRHIDERAVVFLADKLVKGDKIVSIEERFAERITTFAENPEVKMKICANKNNALKMWDMLIGQPKSEEGEKIWKG